MNRLLMLALLLMADVRPVLLVLPLIACGPTTPEVGKPCSLKVDAGPFAHQEQCRPSQGDVIWCQCESETNCFWESTLCPQCEVGGVGDGGAYMHCGQY